MRPLVRRAPNGMRYTTPSGAPQHNPATPKQAKAAPQRGTPRAKLTEDDVREARAWHAAGKFGVKDLAYIFGVTSSTMSCLVHRKTWKHVTEQEMDA